MQHAKLWVFQEIFPVHFKTWWTNTSVLQHEQPGQLLVRNWIPFISEMKIIPTSRWAGRLGRSALCLYFAVIFMLLVNIHIQLLSLREKQPVSNLFSLWESIKFHDQVSPSGPWVPSGKFSIRSDMPSFRYFKNIRHWNVSEAAARSLKAPIPESLYKKGVLV